MKNNRIVRAYDSINPSPAEKAKMLDAILAEANLEEKPARERKKKNTVVYTAKAPKTSKRSNFMAVAASLILLLISSLVLMQMVNRRDVTPAYEKPTAAMEASIPEKTAVDHYEPVLEKYRRAIAEGWSKEECEIEGISTRMETGGDFTKAGYAFLDLDGDGREELIIAEEAVPHYDNIRDIYTTLEDGTPIQIWVDERDGYQGYLYEGNVIGIEYSGKDRGEYVYHTLEKGQLTLKECLMYSNESWVYTTDGAQLTMISPKEATDITYGYEHRKLNLTWLADIPDYLRDTESVEGYTSILEKYKTALTEGWTEHLCEENDISPQLFEGLAGYQSPGWCLLDLDNNGVEELVISDGVYLYDLYTMMPDNSGPGHILCANGGETYQLCENGVIEKHGNYSGTTAWRYYTLRDIDLVQQDMVFYEGAINQYSYGTWDNDLQAITKEKAGEIIGRDQVMKLDLTPFVERPDFWPEDSAQYEPLLNVYRQAVREKWNPGQCMENGISLMVGYYGQQYDELGYAMRDLDNNGVNELIITDGTNIYDLYTLVQQGVEPVQLATAMERVQYFLTTDGRVYCMASGSASVSYYTLYNLEGHELRLLEGYMMDYETDPENPWYYYNDVEKGGSCPTQVAAAAIDPIKFERFTLVYFE